MQKNFKYSLTRVCLRSGQMMLPLKMMELFPSEGSVRAYDTVANLEYSLEMVGPRRVSGLLEFYRSHKLDVNDAVTVSLLEDGRYALTPVVRPKEASMSESDLGQRLADKICELNTPLSSAELRGLFPHLPKDTDVDRLLMSELRVVKQHGRWLPRQRALQDSGVNPAPKEAPRHDSPRHEPAREAQPGAKVSEVRLRQAAPQAPQERVKAEAAEPAAEAGEEAVDGQDDARYELPPKEQAKERQVTVTPYPKGIMFPQTGLNSEQDEPIDNRLSRRAREFLEEFSFRVESLSHEQLLASADLGRRQYTVLAHIHPSGARLDWAGLLARRRGTSATYVAVFGEQRDLSRLVSPAELARATLWSWEGLERSSELQRSLSLGPFDLEAHFAREGLFGSGLDRFEKNVAKRIAERGYFSAVLGRLAMLRAPSVLLLEDVVADLDMSRDQALKVLDVLSHPPFQMIAKVSDGEFCLRYTVPEGLLRLSEYALSLRNQLPMRRHERLRGEAPEEETAALEDAPAVPVEIVTEVRR